MLGMNSPDAPASDEIPEKLLDELQTFVGKAVKSGSGLPRSLVRASTNPRLLRRPIQALVVDCQSMAELFGMVAILRFYLIFVKTDLSPQ